MGLYGLLDASNTSWRQFSRFNGSSVVVETLVVNAKYRVSHLVANLGWVELNLGSSLGWLAIQWVATAQAGWWNIPNPCQQNPVRDQMGHPVLKLCPQVVLKLVPPSIELHPRNGVHIPLVPQRRRAMVHRVRGSLQRLRSVVSD